ncbi:hypothetical protein E3P81_00652 [Wallemia ichthyophaga]|nr:hypothetical protein E3P97_00653 [Wallemia ichthyophaga]TIB35319.1 hypothetical protein E3P85_00509 [Wallemia ichthyophaga]TIB37056.1 hypothetical protein E3P84_00511 [Wallemia ichthyophaga]TIB43484.1 hypothetical protein E3P83_00654 [Wallemia ichthyophaga]TIB49934.1 hypothetical protein E3P82_00650 [Wallemia ichthyophaga]
MKRRNRFNIETDKKTNKTSRVDDDIRAKLWINSSEEPSSNLCATRSIPPSTPYSLVELCLLVVRDNFKQLYQSYRDAFVESFRLLPETHRERLGRSILKEHSQIISLKLIQELFTIPPNISLNQSIPALNSNQYPKLLRELPGGLTTLDLVGFTELSDLSVPLFVKKSPHLRFLKLRGCLSLGERTIEATSTLKELEELDISFTAVPLSGLAKVLTSCCKLRRLDMNAVGRVSTKNTAQWDQMLDVVVRSSIDANLQPLSHLEHLNVGECNISDAALGRWLTLTPSLKALDCHECEITNPMLFLPPNLHQQLVKIDISRMSLDLANFRFFYKSLLTSEKIKVLWMSGVVRNISASDNEYLLTNELLTPEDQDKAIGFAPTDINWSNNPRLRGKECLRHHITSSLKYLNLSGSTFEGSAFNEAVTQNKPVRLENVQLNECVIDDEVVEGILKLKGLKSLGLMKTSIAEDSLNRIIDSCPLLDSINLTLSRNINVRHRRTYFEQYEQSKRM